jgi:hypothetical protein
MTTARKTSPTKPPKTSGKKKPGPATKEPKPTSNATSGGTSTQAQAKTNAPKRMSALDAAARVLATTDQPLRCTELVAEMQKRSLWTSPGGKTPESTLHAAITREIKTKGDAARFKKVERGLFGPGKGN